MYRHIRRESNYTELYFLLCLCRFYSVNRRHLFRIEFRSKQTINCVGIAHGIRSYVLQESVNVFHSSPFECRHSFSLPVKPHLFIHIHLVFFHWLWKCKKPFFPQPKGYKKKLREQFKTKSYAVRPWVSVEHLIHQWQMGSIPSRNHLARVGI